MRENLPSHGFTGRALSWLLPFLLISAGYLYAFPQANVFYAGVVLLHVLSGVVAAILLVPGLIRLLRNGSFFARAGWLLVAAGAVLGLILIKTGTPKTEWKWLYLHIVISLARSRPSYRRQAGRRGWLVSNAATLRFLRTAICLACSPASATARATCAKVGRPAPASRIPPCRPTTWTAKATAPTAHFSPVPRRCMAAENSQQVFHGVRFLQALPRGYLQPVEQFGPPFFFVQQSVVSQVDRVHAGYGRHQAFEMVRRMP